MKNPDDINKLKEYTEEPKELLQILNKLNKTNTANLIKPIKDSSISNNDTENKKMTTDKILDIFNNNTISEICNKYSTKELSDIYFSIYLKKPSSSYKKLQLAEIIKKYVNSINRMDGFKYL